MARPTELTCDFGSEGRTRDVLVGKLHCDIVLSRCCWYVRHGACSILVVVAFNLSLGRSLNSQRQSSCACVKTFVIDSSNTICITEPNYLPHIKYTHVQVHSTLPNVNQATWKMCREHSTRYSGCLCTLAHRHLSKALVFVCFINSLTQINWLCNCRVTPI